MDIKTFHLSDIGPYRVILVEIRTDFPRPPTQSYQWSIVEELREQFGPGISANCFESIVAEKAGFRFHIWFPLEYNITKAVFETQLLSDLTPYKLCRL